MGNKKECYGIYKWHEHESIDNGWVCVNGDSEYCSDWTEYSHWCDEWEERD